MHDTPRYWFPAKRYGWGWGPPTTWQGWIVTIIWLVAYVGGSVVLAPRGPVAFAGFSGAMVLTIIAICLVKGEPPRWRWGDDE